MSDPTPPPAHLEADAQAPDRNLALELVRGTEAAAMAAGRWVGRVATGMNNRIAVLAVSAWNSMYDVEHTR